MPYPTTHSFIIPCCILKLPMHASPFKSLNFCLYFATDCLVWWRYLLAFVEFTITGSGLTFASYKPHRNCDSSATYFNQHLYHPHGTRTGPETACKLCNYGAKRGRGPYELWRYCRHGLRHRHGEWPCERGVPYQP